MSSSLLPDLGSSQYMPTLIRTLLEHPALEEWQFDPTLFSLLLLGLIVKKGGVVVNVPGKRRRKEHVDATASSVIAISESIFGLDARRVDLDESVPPGKLARLVLDRRKRPQQPSRTRSQLVISPKPEPPNDSVHLGPPRSGYSTRYHSAESVLRPRGNPPDSPGISTISPDLLLKTSTSKLAEENGEDTEDTKWPDVLVVTGLEDCESPVQNKLCELVKRSARERKDKQATLLVWVRREDAGEATPSWLADNFALGDTVDPSELNQPPVFDRQALIPQSYISDIAALLPYTHIHPTLTQHLNNLISATSVHPDLQSTLTGRFFNTLPVLVKAHRLLSAPFTLPTDWRANLARLAQPDLGDTQRFGLGGGQGGVNGWARRAGEEPDLAELGDDGEEWHAGPENIRGVWTTAIRHRVKWRDVGEGVMWAITTSAADLSDQQRQAAVAELHVQRRRERKRREAVDAILDDMLTMLE